MGDVAILPAVRVEREGGESHHRVIDNDELVANFKRFMDDVFAAPPRNRLTDKIPLTPSVLEYFRGLGLDMSDYVEKHEG